MKPKWSVRAAQRYERVYRYVRSTFGMKAASDFRKRVKETERLLQSNPQLGALEPLLIDSSNSYRSVTIYGLSKLVYVVEDNTILVADFWDCRWEPASNTENL